VYRYIKKVMYLDKLKEIVIWDGGCNKVGHSCMLLKTKSRSSSAPIPTGNHSKVQAYKEKQYLKIYKSTTSVLCRWLVLCSNLHLQN
jgi:hypothetical protein